MHRDVLVVRDNILFLFYRHIHDRDLFEIVEYIHYINRVYYANIIIKRCKKYNQILSQAYNLLDYLIDDNMLERDRYYYI